ncbi:carbohydrate deacetylase [Urechidicola sp. KH5]
MKTILSSLLFLITLQFQAQNISERLGYPSDAKLLIIHADDLGVSQSENEASFQAMAKGFVNSASAMMPTPWILEVAEYAKANQNHDIGLHLTLTSEWKNYRWGPVTSINEVPSLVNKYGYMHAACTSDFNPDEVEKELVSQIERAYAMGLEPTHLDSHMGCLFWSSPEVLEVYLKVAQVYNLPCLITAEIPEVLRAKYNVRVVVDQIYTIGEEQYANGTEAYYRTIFKQIKPGLNTLLIHTAYDNAEMQAMTVDHPEWGATWRQEDFNFFMSTTCKKLIEDERIILITWREIKEKLYD